MKPAERVEAVLKGESVDKVPFTVYESKIPQCSVERELRDLGLCIVNRRSPGVKSCTPNCTDTQHHYTEDGKRMVRTIIKTPKGDISQVSEPAGFTSWTHERWYKSPEDLPAIKAWIEDMQFEPDYEPVLKTAELFGRDIFLRGGAGGYAPMNHIIYRIMGVETFCFAWMDMQDEIMELHEVLYKQKMRQVKAVAGAPFLAFNCGGNVSPEIVGLDRFETYYVPYYNEVAGILHENNKLMGVHFDANSKLFSEAIAASDIDYIEAFTPAPDTDMTMAEACAAWPDKTMWINFPSSVHLRDNEGIAEVTRQILKQAAPGNKLIIGITEDVPEHRWQESFLTIMRTIEESGKIPTG